MNKYYEGRPLCLFDDTVMFPVDDATPEKIASMGLDAMKDAGLVSAKKAADKAAPKGSETFELTAAGKEAMTPDIFKKGAGNFCYGRRKLTSVDAARRNSSTTELVNYHYAIAQPAAWAMTPAIQTAFPHVATELAGPHAGQATLLDTTDGWEVSGVPATIVPLTTAAAPTRLQKVKNKAKSLLHMKKK